MLRVLKAVFTVSLVGQLEREFVRCSAQRCEPIPGPKSFEAEEEETREGGKGGEESHCIQNFLLEPN